jgi:hypothetical protein
MNASASTGSHSALVVGEEWPDARRMRDLLHHICDRHGIFLRREALAIGIDDRGLARAVRAKVIHRVRHGTYVMGEQWSALDEVGRHIIRAKGVLRTANSELLLSHTTALALLGAPLWDLPLDEVHVTRLDGRAGRREAGIAQHSGVLLPGDVVETDGVRHTSATRSALDLTMITDVEHAVPVLDHLLHVGAVQHRDLCRGADRRDVWPYTLGTEVAVRLADGRSESVGESRSHHMFWRGGLPVPDLQYQVKDEYGRTVARVDFAWPEFGVFLEFDGKEKYTKYLREGESVLDAVLREKKREELICRLTGWRCIRLTWADLYRPRVTVDHIRSVLAGGPVL